MQLFVNSSLTTISNEETFLQDFLENLEEMFPRYYTHNDVCNGFGYSTTCYRVIGREGVNIERQFTVINSKGIIKSKSLLNVYIYS